MDYWNRDEKGNAVKTTKFNEFKTRNGRKVEDGGGVMPDIEITALKTNALTKALLSNSVVFDFATNYYYRNNIASIDDFSFNPSDYEDFRKYVSQSNFKFETNTEKALKEAITADDKAIYGADIQDSYKNLLAEINNRKLNALETYQKEIQINLQDEIIKRYFYREGLYQYYLKNDEAILTATSLMDDKTKYQAILR